MRITKLEIRGKTRDRVAVYVDGRYAFALPASEAVGLHEGQILDEQEFAELETRSQLFRAREAALRLLKYRPRSEKEISDHLSRKGFARPVVEEVIRRLREQRLLDDREFARFWVENRRDFSPSGVYRLRYELRRKGVPDEVIAEALEGIDFEEEAYRAAVSRAHRFKNLPWPEFSRKLGGFLARRGFSYDIIKEVVARLARELNVLESPDPAS